MRLEHTKQESRFQHFLCQVENLDLTYAQNQRVFAKKVQQLVNQNLMRITTSMRALVNQVHADYKSRVNSYRDKVQITAILFDQYKTHFEQREESHGGFYDKYEDDAFILEQRYIMNTE